MNKLIALSVATFIAVGLTSCDDSVLSTSSAKKAINKEAVFAKDYATVAFNTGFYEVNESQLLDLKRLQAAGMISFSTETVIEKVQKSSYNYWTGYNYYTVDEKHIFANVQLTEEGMKYVVENPTTKRADIIEDFKANENYEELIPDYMEIFASDIEEDTAFVEEEPEEVVEVVEENTSGLSDSVETEAPSQPVQESTQTKAEPNAAYNAAIAKVHTEEHQMLLGRFSLEKVKEVRCTEEMAKNGRGECQAIITFKDKTPFGYVYGAPQQDYLQVVSVSFIHYQDLGWIVESIDK